MSNKAKKTIPYIRLTSHPSASEKPIFELDWGQKDPKKRGPIMASTYNVNHKNVIGTYSGSYSVYKALAVASGSLSEDHMPDFTDTSPVKQLDVKKYWSGDHIVSLDPFGANVTDSFSDEIKDGIDIRPTIAITKAHINVPELSQAIKEGRLKADGEIVKESGDITVTKAAIEPVWHLPGIAKRFGISEAKLRQSLFEHTGGMFPELITRPDLHVFLPPIGGITAYIFGDVSKLGSKSTKVSCRVHDECNGSDVFGSDICTCRPYLTHGMEVCIEEAQKGGVGVVIYNRKEGRALGEVTKYLVYNARKRQEGGDRAETYFTRTECVAGVQDVRFQELMPDVLLWLGIDKLNKFVSMSNMKYDALKRAGIEVNERVSIPDEMIPDDAHVEMDAKKAAGYYTDGEVPSDDELKVAKGRVS
jgi:GTP cyclohydrolase II